jgi:hypothetical protein
MSSLSTQELLNFYKKAHEVLSISYKKKCQKLKDANYRNKLQLESYDRKGAVLHAYQLRCGSYRKQLKNTKIYFYDIDCYLNYKDFLSSNTNKMCFAKNVMSFASPDNMELITDEEIAASIMLDKLKEILPSDIIIRKITFVKEEVIA